MQKKIFDDCCLLPHCENSVTIGSGLQDSFSLGASICVVVQDGLDVEDMVDRMVALAFQEGFYQGGDHFLVRAGVAFSTFGAMRFLRIASVSENRTKGV